MVLASRDVVDPGLLHEIRVLTARTISLYYRETLRTLYVEMRKVTTLLSPIRIACADLSPVLSFALFFSLFA